VPQELFVPLERAAHLRAESRSWPSIDLTARQLCDLELLLNGAFAPLRGFMTQAEYESVTQHGRLPDDIIWPAPVTLDLAAAPAAFAAGDRVALRDHEGVMLAALTVEDAWADAAGRRHLGGPLEGVQAPVHHDFSRFRLTPAEAQAKFSAAGWSTVAAFHALSPAPATVLAPAFQAARKLGVPLFVHLMTGPGKPDDVAHYHRVRAYADAVAGHSADGAQFAMLPLALDATAARALLLRAVIAKNFGCTHLLVYGEVPEEVRKHTWELGIEVAPIAERAAGAFATHQPASQDDRSTRGFTVFFTGLSGSGKSTIANALVAKLLEAGGRKVTLLDGDVVRKHLSSELGFSKEHRDLNVRRIGYVASEITKHGGIAICAPIAPYDSVRKEVRHMIEPHGGFVLVHVSTPIDVCEARDRKGLYAKARAGTLQQFTGISDPYEVPTDASLVIDTSRMQVDEAAIAVIDCVRRERFLA
jgi:sulfate adenylyltransferase